MKTTTLRYSPFTRDLKIFWRKFFPVPKSPYTIGEIKDVCAVHLVPPKKLQSFFERTILILKAVKGAYSVGNYLEFGVFNGSSMASMYKASVETNTVMKFYGFDAFQGLPEGAEKEDHGVWKKGFYSCSFEKMKECLRRRRIDPDHIKWIPGWYDTTLNPKTIGDYGIENPGVIFIDCDTYSSSKAVLEFVKNFLYQEPVILCFDDWKLFDLDVKGGGEYQAFNEFLDQNPTLHVLEIKSYNRKSRSFLVTPKKLGIKFLFLKLKILIERLIGRIILR